MNNINSDYMSYGHYGYYKSKILQKMFAISEDMVVYISEFESKESVDDLSKGQISKLWTTPIKLKIAIIELLPKLHHLKGKEKKFNFTGIENIVKIKTKDLVYDFELLTDYYQKYISLIEALGYSDMNIVKDSIDHFVVEGVDNEFVI